MSKEGGVEEIRSVVDGAAPGDVAAAAPRKLKKKLVKKKKKKKAAAPAVGEGGSAGTSVEDGLLLRSAIKLQRMFRLRKLRVNVERMIILNKMRRNIQQEMLQTERNYVKGLQQLKRDFVHPLSKLLSEVEMANVFPAVNEIWKLHEQFLATLEATMQTEDLTKSGTERRKLAEIFSELASNCEKVYSPFLNQFQQASLVLKRLMENDPFKVGLAVESICSPRSSGISGLKYLGELMITPMQRLPRYELLFKELVKCTSELHPDYANLEKALADIQALCQGINEKKRASDEKQRRGFLEQHASMEVLRAHVFEVRSITTVKFCGKCEKSVFSIGKKGQKCTECALYFHNECAVELGDGKHCPQRRRLDLSSKELLDQVEVLLMPEEEEKLKPASSKSGNKLQLPGSNSGGKLSIASPSMKRLSEGPGAKRRSMSSANLGAPGVEIRALLFCFQDGLAVAHKWIFQGDEDRPIIDMIGELPWKTVSLSVVPATSPNMCPFVITNNAKGGAVVSMRFYLKTPLEVQALEKNITTVQRECLAAKEKKQSERRRSKKFDEEKGHFRSMLASSERYKKSNQRDGGSGEISLERSDK